MHYSINSIKDYVHTVYNSSPVVFNILDLVKNVRDLAKRQSIMDASITRTLAKLRVDGEINYVTKKHGVGMYEKLEIVDVKSEPIYLKVNADEMNRIVGTNNNGIFDI